MHQQNLHHGREAVLPVELQMTDETVEKLHVDSDTVQSYVAHVEKMKQELFPVVDLNIKKAQKKQKIKDIHQKSINQGTLCL